MQHTTRSPSTKLAGIGIAALTTVIWSGNFIVARTLNQRMPPVSINFYRWLIASVVLLPFAWSAFWTHRAAIRKHFGYLFLVSLCGVALFNTFVYVGGHYTSAINLAIIGTTSSPIMVLILARIFLKESLDARKVTGMLICLSGVLYVISKGSLNNLAHFTLSQGDAWVLLAALSFAIYNTMVRRKPVTIPPMAFLMAIFLMGTLMMFPAFLWELRHSPKPVWDGTIAATLLYLGIAASAICYPLWNRAIALLGAGPTALFGNLIPVFASIEAAVLLNESFTLVHVIGMVIVFAGIIIANWSLFQNR